MDSPLKSHWLAIQRILRYLKGKYENGKKPLKTIIEEPTAERKPEEEDKETTKTPQLWVGKIRGNRLPSNSSELLYMVSLVINGEIEIQLEEKDVASEMELWKNAIIMYAIGNELPMNAVKKFMSITWYFVAYRNYTITKRAIFLLDTRTVWVGMQSLCGDHTRSSRNLYYSINGTQRSH